MVYFQGTDNVLWRLNQDGTGGTKFFGYKCGSPPVVYGNTIYFQGTDNKLWRVDLDGSNAAVLGNNTTASSPFVTATGVYFRGTDDQLWRIKADGTGQFNVGGNTTAGSPYVIGQYVFFRGTDNKLWRIKIDGTQGINLGFFKTSSSPVANLQFVFFRGTDDKLWRCNLDGTGGIVLGGGYKTASTPCVTDNYVFFRGTDDKLWRTDLNGNGGIVLGGGYKTSDRPTVDTSENLVYFRGTDNALWRTDLDGNHGTHLGGFKTASTPFVVQPRNQPTDVSFPIPYQLLLLVYSPPGSNNGKNVCSVQYSSGSTAGTKVTIADSFTQTYGITATIKGKVESKDAEGSFGLEYSDKSESQASFEIKKTESNDLKVAGPPADGINHDDDAVYILLNPTMNVVIDPMYNLSWSLDFQSGSGGVVYLKMNWLKDLDFFAQNEPSVKQRCDAAGMKSEDYAQLLALNPFANGAVPIDPARYQLVTNWFYIPPDKADTPVPTADRIVDTQVTYANVDSETTGWKLTAGIQLPRVFDVALKASGALNWTTSRSTQTSSGFEQKATITFGAPAFGYAGSTQVLVYLDTMFNTYMFVLSDQAPSVTGMMTDPAGIPMGNAEVQLSIGSSVFYAWTSPTGEYRFYDVPPGEGSVTLVKPKHVPVPSGGHIHFVGSR